MRICHYRQNSYFLIIFEAEKQQLSMDLICFLLSAKGSSSRCKPFFIKRYIALVVFARDALLQITRNLFGKW